MTDAWHSFVPAVQLDGSAQQGSNCNPTSAGNVAVSDQSGVRPPKGSPWHPTGASVRAAIRPVDKSGGTTLAQVDQALRDTYGLEPAGIDLDVRYRYPIASFAARLEQRQPAVLQGAESATRGTPWQGSETFGDNHSWSTYGHRGSAFPHGETLIHDPLWDGRRAGIPSNTFRWIPDRYVVAFAKGLDLDGKGHLLGPGLVYVGFGAASLLIPAPPDTGTTPGVTYRYGGEPKGRGVKVVDIARARLRRSPYLRDDNTIRTVAKGYRFGARQRTTKGTLVRWRENGTGKVLASRTWFGDATGKVWIHESCIDPAK